MKYYLPKKAKNIHQVASYEKLKYDEKGDYVEVNFITFLCLKIKDGVIL